MSTRRSELIAILEERGFIHQCTDLEALDELAAAQTITAYVGYDLTADSLHIGHIVSIMMLRRLQQAGHRPIALVGGGTTRVGDPSFKDESRPLLTDKQIQHNKAGIKRSLGKFLSFDAGSALLEDNAAWLDELGYIPFLRDFGRHFTINRMLTFDSVRLRLEREQPLTLLEFNYMVMQAYDFLELSRRHDCRLQMGGSDQWGNIVNGVELGRRIDGKQLFGLTTPLITTSSGQKMGKSAAGAIWLNEDRLRPFDYWQFWRNTEDADVGRFLRLFTDLPIDEIRRLEALQGAEVNEAKRILATEATAMAHGEAEATAAAAAAAAQFGGAKSVGGLPEVVVDRARADEGFSIVELLQLAHIVGSNGEARRLIRGGGVRIDDRTIEDETSRVESVPAAGLKISAGKKRHVIIRPA
ncbi:tyrosyl-tRNA synthetase [Arboricoccus pini]|uniref:Tyrosine--tRNA ligase n=1 Tax=Arboricoccus pini TaxID=1963835 RepID=A0A212R5E5_9PROT|nr:tyrosine--tRNA ligase [Arboricoccus pini]SNB67279.1 tyrosyl-tRNA synthetase [Arboricoccus pini]